MEGREGTEEREGGKGGRDIPLKRGNDVYNMNLFSVVAMEGEGRG